MPAAWLCWQFTWGERESAWCPFACGDIGLYPGDLTTPGKAEEDGVGREEGSSTASLMEDMLEQQAQLT